MDKDKLEIMAMDYLAGMLDEGGKIAFEKWLKEHPESEQEFWEIQVIWEQIARMETRDPSTAMDERFYDLLHQHMASGQKKRVRPENHWLTFLSRLWVPQLAFGMVLLGIGLGIGYYLSMDRREGPATTTVVSKSETQNDHEKLVLTLLEESSVNKRLQGVNEANKIEKVDEGVINALLQTLNNDPNVNVRLAAIEALTHYVDNPMVRTGLVQSIIRQNSPIVQVTLANLMVALQEKKSIEHFKTLIRGETLDATVKKKLEESIHQII